MKISTLRATLKSASPVAVALSLALLSTAQADWNAPLEGGGRVSVDPSTNRATLTRDGVTTPLWDGVHRLRDGSAITVKSGQVVPNAAILHAREQPPRLPETDPASAWIGQPLQGESPCERLVRRTCGAQGHCAASPGCDPARQLLTMERRERQHSGTPDRMTYSSGQCVEAAADTAFFRACP